MGTGLKQSTIDTLAMAVTALAALAGCAHAPAPDGSAATSDARPVPGAKPAPCSRPVYPLRALADKVEGTSTIGFLISTEGKVIDSRLYKSSGDASLDEAARSGLAKCTFRPPSRDGKPVQAWVPVQYVWTLD